MPLSSTHISLSLSKQQRLNIRSFELNVEDVFPENSLLPEICSCGAGWLSKDSFYCQGVLYTLGNRKLINVWCRKCKNNTCVHHYDGQQDCIFNYSGQSLISYDILIDYHSSLLTSQTSFTGYVKKINFMYKKIHSNLEDNLKFLSIATFEKVSHTTITKLLTVLLQIYCAFASLLRSEELVFVCPICGPYPKVL